MQISSDFTCHLLDGEHGFYQGQLLTELQLSSGQFDDLWNMHPDAYTELVMHGRRVLSPRWQQAYGRDYHYTGQVNRALPVPRLLQPLVAWSQSIDPRLNGLLVNWYDGGRGHYMGKHRDSISGLCPGSPIVTMSFGEERTFRLRPHKGAGMNDFLAKHGTVFIMPWETNRTWTHEVPKATRYTSRRISVTVRAFIGS